MWDDVDWNNLIDSINEEDKKMPFIGSIILKSDTTSDLDEGDDEDKTYLVIDGQQRLTTLTILIKAFLDVYKNINTEYKSVLLGMIYEIDDQGDDPIHTPRIKPSNSDSKEFEIVMEDAVDMAKLEQCEGAIAEAYKHYINLFASYDETKLKTISSKLRTNKSFFIAIVVGPNDDEQKIFDSVNSLGKKLTNADIIKNYLYQQLKSKTGSDLLSEEKVLKKYKKDWENVFYSDVQKGFWNQKVVLGRIESTYLETFFKDYGIVSGIYSPLEKDNFKGIVRSFKEHINSLDLDGLNALSKDISDYANAYFNMFHEYNSCNNFIISDKYNTTMLLLDKLQTSTFNPFILKLVKQKPTNVEEQLFSLQRFIIKRLIYGLQTKNYNKFCEQLIESDNPIGLMDNYVDFNTVNYKNYPSGLLNIKNAPATIILFFIEMIKRKGEEDKHNALDYTDKMSLEHIMPQSWPSHWLSVPCYEKVIDSSSGIESFNLLNGADEVANHRPTKICSIGNMTILPGKLNSSVSNSEFSVKIEGASARKKGIRNYTTNMLVVKEIVNYYDKNKKWDERDIYTREVELFDILNSYYVFF